MVVLVGVPAGLATLVVADLPAEPLALAPLRSALPATRILAADGTLLAALGPSTQQVALDADSIPAAFTDALIAAEDARFYTHHGVDWASVLRAAKANRGAGRITQGGSTITQQLVKVRSGDSEDTLWRKAREALQALRIDRSTPKDEIIAAYANSVYFGSGYTGIEAASQGYFGHSATSLNLAEAALLVGVLPSPTVLSPRANPAGAEQHRLHVLDRIAAETDMSDAVIADARTPPVVLAEVPASTSEGWFVTYVRQWLGVHGFDDARLAAGGLIIETTLDPLLQQAARDAAYREFPDPNGPEVALAVLDAPTSAVRALVSGRDFTQSQVDLARGVAGGGSGRQPGSTAKVFTLAAWIESGRSVDALVDAPASVQPAGWSEPVRNADGAGHGLLTVRHATEQSVNTAFVNMADEVGLSAVADVAIRAGAGSVQRRADAGELDSAMVLGAAESSPLEMASVFATFAAGGVRHEPTPVAAVIDSHTGRVLWDLDDQMGTPVFDRSTTTAVIDVLGGVVARGTGVNAAVPGVSVFAKTGTSQNSADIWFAGATPELAVTVWAGYPAAQIPLVHPDGTAMFGGDGPAAVFASLIAATAAPSRDWFDPAAGAPSEPPTMTVTPGEPSTPVDAPRPPRRRTPALHPPTIPTSTTTTTSAAPVTTAPGVAPPPTTTTTTSLAVTSTSTTLPAAPPPDAGTRDVTSPP